MAKAPARHRLTLSKLDFLSLVDVPAQSTADIRLIKRDDPELVLEIFKTDESNASDPLLWCWAFTSTHPDGSLHYDRQGDAITPDFRRVAEDFIKAGGLVDDLHDGVAKSRIAFAFPWDQDIAKALLGPEAAAANKTVGLMVAIRPTPDQLVKAKSGKYLGVSIAGTGLREALDAVGKSDSKCASCSAYIKTDETKCEKCSTGISKTIREEDGKYVLYSADGEKKLSTHDTKEDAEAQERAIQANKQAVDKGTFREEDHPREHGKFSSGGGGGGGKDDKYKDSAKTADAASEKARSANTASAHADATTSHREASAAASAAGHHDLADLHAKLASNHAFSAGNIARTSGTGADRSAAFAAHGTAAHAFDSRASHHLSGEDRHDPAKQKLGSDLLHRGRMHVGEAGKFTPAGVDGIQPTRPRARAEHAGSGVDSIQPRRATSTGASHASSGVDSIKPRTKKRFTKQAVLTSVTDGHQHQVNLEDPAEGWKRDQLTTSYNTADGADNGHSHAWIFDPVTGVITIAEDSGHNHTVDAVVPQDVLAEAAANTKQCPRCSALCDADDRYCPMCGGALTDGDSKCAASTAVADEPSGAKSGPSGPTVVVVQARAPESNSPPAEASPSVENENKEHAPMATDALQILTQRHEALEKRNVYLEKFAQLTDAEKAHYDKLVGQDKDVFLNKGALDRLVEISEIAKADELIYTSPVDGEQFRKSCDPRMLKLKKQADEATIALRVESQKRADGELARKGDELLSAFSKGAKGNLKGRLMKALNTEFTDPTDWEEAVEMLKGANVALLEASKPKGYTPKVDVSEIADPKAQLDTLAKRYSEEHKVPFEKGYTAVLNTDAGRALYAAADKVARA